MKLKTIIWFYVIYSYGLRRVSHIWSDFLMRVHFLSKLSIYHFLYKKEGNEQLVLVGSISTTLILTPMKFSSITEFYELYWFLTDKSNDLHSFMMFKGMFKSTISAFTEVLYTIGQQIGRKKELLTVTACVRAERNWLAMGSSTFSCSPHSRASCFARSTS